MNIAAACRLLLSATLAHNVQTFHAAHPNVTLIITDDQDYGDMLCHSNPVLKTPHLDRIHARGVRFTGLYVDPCARRPEQH